MAFAFVHIANMSRFETTFRNAIANAERDVLVDQIRANPQMSLNELGKLATGELGKLLNQITVADLIGAAAEAGRKAGGKQEKAAQADSGRKAGGKQEKAAQPETGRKSAEGAGRKPAQAETGRKPGKAAQVDVDTRTAEGRAAYDDAVLAALRAATGPQSASELTAVAGGSPLQIRTALARLIEAGSVSWSGRARGTRYKPA